MDLTLKDFIQRVLARNESLQVRQLEVKISQKRFQAERGIFEPEVVLGYDRVENKRENTAEQRRSTGVDVFKEKNNIYNSGLEGLIPTGGKVRLGYTLRDLRNNLQDPVLGTIYTNKTGREYQSFAGVSLTQPLLKNAWFPATMANIRLASLGGEVAFQEYRRQLMIIITTAEAAYWNLYLAQEQIRFFQESVRIAEELVKDNEERLKQGRGSELEIMEARAGLATRRTKLAEAQQKYFETVAQVSGLMSEKVSENAPGVRALDSPEPQAAPMFEESGAAALALNPDYLAQVSKLAQENIRVVYAKNQRLPQLDLNASYGLNGLGSSPGSSLDDLERWDYPSFMAGVELRIPLGGGVRSRNDLDAAQLRKQQAIVQLHEIETQILNAITTALRKMRTSVQSVIDYEQIEAFNQALLQTDLERLKAGKVDSRRVLETDAALFEARNAVIEAKVLSARARLELELVQGSVLRDRSLEFSRKELLEKAVGQTGFSPGMGTQVPGDDTGASKPGSTRPPRPASSAVEPVNSRPFL